MAAGRVDVSRRRGYNGRFNKYFDRNRNGSVEHGVVYKNGYHSSSDASNFYFRRTGLSCRDAEGILGYFQEGNVIDHSSRLEDGEIPRNDDGIQLPPEKRRKFSPIIWDLEDKVALKNSVLPATTAIHSQSPPSASGKGLNDATDAGAAKYAVPVMSLELVSEETRVAGGSAPESWSKSPAILSSPSPLEKYGVDGQDEEEEFAEARNISMSRWASESDSPRDVNLSDDEGIPRDRLKSSGSSQRDSCSVSVCEDEDFGNKLEDHDSKMDNGGIQDENGFLNQIQDSLGEVEEPNCTTQKCVNMPQTSRSVYEYEKLHEINEGTYGKVYKAKDKKTGKFVALKKVKMDVGGDRNLEDYGFPLSSLREINILASFHHPSIVNIEEVVMSGLDGVFMVMEYMEHDLKGLMQVMKQPFSTSEVKCLMLQLLEGVKYLHDNWVLHRDLKTSNLLLNNQGELKICDFGMSRRYGSPLKPYTSLVVTLWYRAPELLLGAKQYSTAIDMWSVGCIMAELLGKDPLFKGKSEIDQLAKIFRVLGTPSEASWPGFSKLPGSKANFVKQPHNLLRKKFPATSFTGSPVLSDLGFDLLNKLLSYDPEKRITADAALNHPWFSEVPLPKEKEFMPTFPPQYARKM